MSCVDLVCGTGDWSGPKPGDPDNPFGLSARAVLGGIELFWAYPHINPYSVAFVIIYRSPSADFESATEIGRVSGTNYLDRFPLTTVGYFYYWIRVVSIYGTDGDLVGPVGADLVSSVGELIEALTAKIDSGVLATELRERIERVDALRDGLVSESLARENDVLTLSATMQQLEAIVDDSSAMITTETLARISAFDAIAQEVTTLTSDFQGVTAGLNTQVGVLSTSQAATALALTTLESAVDGELAQVQQTMQTTANTVGELGALYSVKVNANGLAGGFGVYNDGQEVEAGFDVDTFWIGRTNTDKKKPFIIANDVVYINQAMIQDATISNAKINDAAITTVKIADANITAAKIANAQITTAHIADAQITSAKIGTAEVGTLKIAGEAVTVPRGAAVSHQVCWSSADLCHVYVSEAITLFVSAGGSLVTREGTMSNNYAGYPASGALLKDGGVILSSNGFTRLSHVGDYGVLVPGVPANFSFGTVISGPGTFAIRLATGGTYDVYGAYVSIIGCKR